MKYAIWSSVEKIIPTKSYGLAVDNKRDRDTMICFKNIICLLYVVVAVASDDQFDQCALVNELVEQGEVRNSRLL